MLPGKFEFPDYGFLLIDPYSARTVYEIKTTYHKPVKNAGFVAFRRGAGATPTPLRHVLSYRFVDAVLTKGSWDHHDLLKWGWPVEMSPEEWQDKEAVARRYKRQVREGGVDEELEKGWMWPTSSIFNACEPGHDFTEELEQLNDLKQRERTKEKATAAKSRQQEKEMDAWIQGVVVTNTKLNLQTKFYLHNDIEEDEERKLVRLILVWCLTSLRELANRWAEKWRSHMLRLPRSRLHSSFYACRRNRRRPGDRPVDRPKEPGRRLPPSCPSQVCRLGASCCRGRWNRRCRTGS